MNNYETAISPLLIKGADVFVDGQLRRVDLLLSEGRIARIDSDIVADDAAMVVNADGLAVIPGLVDLHVHFREPGFEYKETIATGSRAAARGGFTTVCPMPNLKPAPDSPEHLRLQLDIIDRDAVVEVLPYATITEQRLGRECVDFASMAPDVAGFSDDGTGVQDEDVMRKAMLGVAATGSLLAAHCEVDSLLRGGYIHDGEYARVHGHRGICSESEWKEVERDIRLAEETGARLHICHVSTKESVDLVRQAKKRGVKVTCETGPHYLAFCDEDLQEDGRFKMNPPLRSRADMEALRQGVADGAVDVIATDHAPHAADEKNRGLEKSAMGVVGLETSLAAVNTFMTVPGRISFARMIELMSDAGRRLLGRREGIYVGGPADLAIVDFNREFRVDPSEFVSKGKATPFDGLTLKGKVMMTVAGGKVAYSEL